MNKTLATSPRGGRLMSTPSFTKRFPNYETATRWLYANGYDGPVIHFDNPLDHNGPCKVILEGEQAQLALDKERPLAPGGFRIRDLESIG